MVNLNFKALDWKNIGIGLLGTTIVTAGVFGITSFSKDASSKEKAEKTQISKSVTDVKKADNKPRCEIPAAKADKEVYLTFDDGPSIYTEKLINELEKEKIKGTFFVIGSNVNLHKDALKKLADSCNPIGMHSMTHDQRKLYNAQNPGFVGEMQQLQKILKDDFKYETNFARAPYGSTYAKPNVIENLKKNNIKLWDWTVDSMDWKHSNSPNAIFNNIKNQIEKHGNSKQEVILMHEKPGTVAALPQIIKYLREKGYTFKVYDSKNHIPVNFKNDPQL